MFSISIAEIERSHLPDVAQTHIAAFPESALTKFGVEAVRRYYEWQLIGPYDVKAWGAFVENRLAGFCFAGDFRGVMTGFLRRNRTYLAYRIMTHPWLITSPVLRARLTMRKRILALRDRSNAHPAARSSRSFGVHSIATRPGYQRLGIGTMLMERAERCARDSGFNEMHLAVAVTNANAIKFYEDLDWTKQQEGGSWRGRMIKVIKPF